MTRTLLEHAREYANSGRDGADLVAELVKELNDKQQIISSGGRVRGE